MKKNKYSYKAVNKEGEYVNGSVSATNPAELSSMLKSDGLEIISYRIQNASFLTITSNKVPAKDLITTFIHLEQLDRAGVPIIDSISDLKETSDVKAVKSLMQEIYESVKNGNLFSEAMSRHPDVFNSVYVGLVANGEKTGDLTNAFASIVDDLKWNVEFKRKIRKASIGPSFAILMMVVIIGVMMGFVVPKVTGFLTLQDISIPNSTRSLIAASNFIQNYWFILLFGFPSIYFLLKILGKIPKIGVKMDAFKLKIPLFGPIITKLEAAKFCQFFAMTFRSGLGVIECLDSASMVIKNEAIKRNITFIKVKVSEGQSLTKAISASDYFPSLVKRMFKVGEESGNMEESLNNIKFFYNQEINDTIDRLVSMIQPALTMVMGALIMWVVIAVFGPIYGSFSNIQ